MQLKFGKINVIRFDDERDFFLCLGYLSNPDRTAHVNSEKYDSKYGVEDRIWLRNINSIPKTLKLAKSDGGNYAARINCNEYIQYIILNYGFPNTDESRIPNEYKQYYFEGKQL